MPWDSRVPTVAARPRPRSARHRRAWAACLVPAALAVGAPGARAQTPDGDLDADDALDPLVITGTRGERRLLDVPVRTEVVTREEIERTHARDVAEALANEPGVLLNDIHGKNGTEISLQGFDSDRVLVLLDGRPVSASTGSTVDLTQIGTADVERIELVKGAVSALYGSDAMGGVVNVITRRGDAPTGASLTLDAGGFGERGVGDAPLGERHLALGGNLGRGPLDARVSLDVRDGDGYDLDPDTFDVDGAEIRRVDLSAEIGLELGRRDRVTFRNAWYDESGARDFATFAPGVGDIEKLDGEDAARLTQTIDWRRELGDGESLSAWASFERFENGTVQDVLATGETDQRREAEILTARAELQYDRPVGRNQVWTVGATATDVSLDQRLERREGERLTRSDEVSPGSDRTSVDVFVQNDVFVGERWELLPGLRVQNDSDFGTHVAPKLNVLYEPSALPGLNPRVRAAIGTGYRVPNLKERHYLFDHSSLGYVVLGDEALEPEESLSLQLGLELSRSAATRAEVALFHNDIENLIATVRDADASAERSLEVLRYGNVDEARTRGVETSVRHAFGPSLSASAAWTLTDATDESTGLDLTRRPRHQVQLGTDLTFGRTSVALRATWRSEEFVDAENEIRSPAWTAIALKLNRTVSERLGVFAGIDNLADETRDADRAGLDLRPDRGRFVYAGLRYAL